MMSVKVKGRNGLVISVPDQVASGLIAEGAWKRCKKPSLLLGSLNALGVNLRILRVNRGG